MARLETGWPRWAGTGGGDRAPQAKRLIRMRDERKRAIKKHKLKSSERIKKGGEG